MFSVHIPPRDGKITSGFQALSHCSASSYHHYYCLPPLPSRPTSSPSPVSSNTYIASTFAQMLWINHMGGNVVASERMARAMLPGNQELLQSLGIRRNLSARSDTIWSLQHRPDDGAA